MSVHNSDIADIFDKMADTLEIQRKPYDVDMEKVLGAASERGCVLEVNGHPDRMDLADINCRMAKDMDAKVVISTDAHSRTDLRFMRFGVAQARRGWLGPEDVLNTKSLADLRKALKRR